LRLRRLRSAIISASIAIKTLHRGSSNSDAFRVIVSFAWGVARPGRERRKLAPTEAPPQARREEQKSPRHL
jgi:hypothetical protein